MLLQRAGQLGRAAEVMQVAVEYEQEIGAPDAEGACGAGGAAAAGGGVKSCYDGGYRRAPHEVRPLGCRRASRHVDPLCLLRRALQHHLDARGHVGGVRVQALQQQQVVEQQLDGRVDHARCAAGLGSSMRAARLRTSGWRRFSSRIFGGVW